jgi:CysZ protein
MVRGIRDLFAGVACLGRGLVLVLRSPGLWFIGLVPAVVALAALVVVLAALVFALPPVIGFLTPFAAGWPAADREALRWLLELMLLVGAGWLGIISFTALTLAIGQPFYEAIARRVDAEQGASPPDPEQPGWRAIGRAARDGLLMVALSAALGLALFLLGLVPLLGQTVVPVLGACVAGWLLAAELSAVAFERRGVDLPVRLRLLWRHRLLTVGFGLAAFLLFLIPLGTVLCMPGAVAGGTLLARRVTPLSA